MARKRKEYTREFKEEAVRLALESNQSIIRVARELGIAKATIYNWIRAQEPKEDRNVNGSESKETEKEELERLRKDNKRLRMEQEILKKATAFFAREKVGDMD